jgi:CHAT domain-containing protein/tetratricopeptide (TPR) repeat protein
MTCHRRVATHLFAALFCVAVSCWCGTEPGYAQTSLSLLSDKANKLLADQKYKEATPVLKQLIDLQEKSGQRDSAATLKNMEVLVALYTSQSQYANAEALLRKILERRERIADSDSKDLIDTLTTLGAVLHSLQRTAEALPFLARGLQISEARLPPDHPTTLMCASNLAIALATIGQDAKAEPLFLRVLAAQEKSHGPDQPASEVVMLDLARLYFRLGNYAQAERFYLRVLGVKRKTRGELDRDTLTMTHDVAKFYAEVGNYMNAAELYNRVIEGRERVLGPDDPSTLSAVNGLAMLFVSRGGYKAAEPLFLRLYQADLRLRGPDDEQTRLSLQNLAVVYFELKDYAKAEPLFLRLLAAQERATGRDSREALSIVQTLGVTSTRLKQYAKAEELYRRILNAPNMNDRRLKSAVFAGLADVYLQQKRWQQAREFMVKHFEQPSSFYDRNDGGVAALGQLNNRLVLIRVAGRIVQEGLEPADRHAGDTFVAAQWLSNTAAAQSLRRMAVRSLPRDGKLEAVIREHQDLSDQVQAHTALQAQLWNSYDTMYLKELKYDSKTGWQFDQFPVMGRDRVIDAQAGGAAQLASLNARLKELDIVLARQFPQYAELIAPQPLSVAEVQAQLLPNEALVLLLGTNPMDLMAGETFVWVITKDRTRWTRSDLDAASLAREVQALRCGLDEEAWSGPECGKLLGVTYSQEDAKARRPLPFAYSRAHQLYKSLFGEIEEMVRDKHLLIVPSGALTQLPFHVLVTEAIAGSAPDPRKVAWLARKHAVTVLPSVSSLKTLRRIARPSAGSKPMLGIGNPLLNGDPGDPEEAEWARLSRGKQVCPQTLWERVAGLFEKRRSGRRVSMRSGYADLKELRSQVPLHDTADEVCAVAKDLTVAADDILLGARATEAAIKQLNSENRLGAYRILYFATHGTLAGQIGGTSEPGLILTPPLTQSDLDDGYLSASEVAALKLDADWVILSACNTAGGGAQGAQAGPESFITVTAGTPASARNDEALSGLARAFIYAGARSLLVSHWAVASPSAAKLVSSAVGEIAREPRSGRAEALRRAMLMMIDKGEPRHAHPTHWAPFVLVGEGAPAR